MKDTVDVATANRLAEVRFLAWWTCGLPGCHWRREPDSVRSISRPSRRRNFNTGVVLDTDSWRIQAVMLMTIAAEDDVAVVENPNRMMAIANGLAAAGVPRVVVMLKEGNDEPIWNVSEAVCDLLDGGLGD